MPQTGYITSFSPYEATAGESVGVEAQPILVSDEGGIVEAAVWSSTSGAGAPYLAPSSVIVDFEDYSQFTVALPEEMDAGKYTLRISLRIDGQRYELDSEGIELEVIGESELSVSIGQIVPPTMTMEDLKGNRTITVRGTELDKITLWSMQSRPSPMMMRSVGDVLPDIVMLRPMNVPEDIQPGRYKLKGTAAFEGTVFSKSTISIEE